MSRFTLPRAWALAAALAVPAACSSGTTSPPPLTATTVPDNPSSADRSGTTDQGPPPDPAVHLIEVSYSGGQVAGGAHTTTVRLGEKVRLRVTSDVTDEIHVHTYDLMAEVGPGRPAVVDLTASIPGRHEVELEKKRRQLLVLEVR